MEEETWVRNRISNHYNILGKSPSMFIHIGNVMPGIPVTCHIDAESWSMNAMNELLSNLSGNSIDVLVINAHYSYSNAKACYNSCLPHVSSDGIIVICGICNIGTPNSSMVGSFWCDILHTKPFEGMYDQHSITCGIGIIYNGAITCEYKIRDDILCASGLLPTEQIKEELSWFINNALDHLQNKARVVVEIGSLYGGTSALLTALMQDGGTLICIDPGPDTILRKDYISNVASIAGKVRGDNYTYNIELIKARSEEYASFLALDTLLDGKSIDVLFIDGDHTGKHPLYDYTLYGSMVNMPGIIGFHDIRSGTLESLWKTISNKEKHKVLGTGLHRLSSYYGIGMLLL